MARPDIRKFVLPGNVLDPWDRVPWNDFPGKPKIFVPSGEIYENRQYKYIFDALRAAQLNTTLIESEGDYRLQTTCPFNIRIKTDLIDLCKEVGLPALETYPLDPDIIQNITTPVFLKPQQGKNSYDPDMRSSYKVYPNGPALLAALRSENHGIPDDLLKKRYFVEESGALPNGSVSKVLGMILINSEGVCKCFHVDEQTWTPRTRSTNLDLAIRRPTNAHVAVMEEMAKKVADYRRFRNCCLYIQAIIKNGVYYYNDADVCIPKLYAVALNKYLPEHLNFMFDQVSDITIPTEYVVTKTLTSLKGAKETHLNLLESRAAQYNAFYWIQRFNFNPAEEVGRYMLMTSGATEEAALDTMNAWVEYLTLE